MKQMVMIFCSLILVLSLAACTYSGNNPLEQASTGSGEPPSPSSTVSRESVEATSVGSGIPDRLIQITTDEGNEIVFQLNDSFAANDLYNQLPLNTELENYGSNEKIFYPPEDLDIRDAPLASGPAGTLAFYAPWGNVAIYYGECGGASGLYALGEAVSGVEFISTMTGEVQIEAVGSSSASPGSAESEKASSQQAHLSAPSSVETPVPQESTNEISSEENTNMKMNVQIGNSTFTATLEENAAVEAFVGLMKTAPLVIQMSDYSGFEKVGSLGSSLPASNSQTTTQSGDIVLYNGNQIVIFYGPNSWSYTRLGKIDDLSGWEEALGNGDVTVTFSVE